MGRYLAGPPRTRPPAGHRDPAGHETMGRARLIALAALMRFTCSVTRPTNSTSSDRSAGVTGRPGAVGASGERTVQPNSHERPNVPFRYVPAMTQSKSAVLPAPIEISSFAPAHYLSIRFSDHPEGGGGALLR